MVIDTLYGFLAVLLGTILLLALGFATYCSPANRYSALAIRLWVRAEVIFFIGFFVICALAGCYQIGATLRAWFL